MKKEFKNEYLTLSGYEKELAKYMYNEYITFARYGKDIYSSINSETFKELKLYYDSTLKKKTFNKISKLFNKTLDNKAFRYYSNSVDCNKKCYSIQLNDNHTMFAITREDFDFNEYQHLVDDFLNGFELDTKTKVYQDGRSGRHIVVENNVENFINYNWLRDTQVKLEREMINYINNCNE